MENRHFNLIVAGDNPDLLVAPFDSNLKVAPYVVYEYKKAEEYYKNKIKLLENLLKLSDLDNNKRLYIEEELSDIKAKNSQDFYLNLTEGYTLDEKTGNAMSSENPEGKYNTCSVAKNFALPFILKDGTESYSAKKKDIDWEKIHLANRKPYEVAWDTVMENKKPKDKDEEIIYNNMKERKFYFSSFGNRENYVNSCTAFWGFAFLSKKEGWKELDGKTEQFEWVKNFYNTFIKPLSDNTLITIYECIRN